MTSQEPTVEVRVTTTVLRFDVITVGGQPLRVLDLVNLPGGSKRHGHPHGEVTSPSVPGGRPAAHPWTGR